MIQQSECYCHNPVHSYGLLLAANPIVLMIWRGSTAKEWRYLKVSWRWPQIRIQRGSGRSKPPDRCGL